MSLAFKTIILAVDKRCKYEKDKFMLNETRLKAEHLEILELTKAKYKAKIKN